LRGSFLRQELGDLELVDAAMTCSLPFVTNEKDASINPAFFI